MSDAATPEPTPTGTLKTKPATRWLLKTLLMTLLPVGLGVWGLYDALVAYPDRGEKVASYRLLAYLETARPTYGWEGPAGVPTDEDPRAVMEELRNRRSELETAVTGTNARLAAEARTELNLLDYLESLNVMFRLTPERAHIADPAAKFQELEAEWLEPSGEPRDAPKPLTAYDIPVQWIFVTVGAVAAVWGTIFIVSIVTKTYRFDPETLKLTLPTGETIVPEQVAEFDKRKWDKFLIFLKMKETHESLGGREIKLDLYRYDPLEDWAVAMHKTAFPEDYEDEEQDEPASQEASPQDPGPESEQAKAS